MHAGGHRGLGIPIQGQGHSAVVDTAVHRVAAAHHHHHRVWLPALADAASGAPARHEFPHHVRPHRRAHQLRETAGVVL